MKIRFLQKIKEKMMRSHYKIFHGAKNNGETGRGMVEMLGVLAIIGVLTIGAIWGYNHAMKIYRVNEMIEALNRQAVLASAAKAVGADLPKSEWETSAAGFEIEYNPTYTEDGEVYDNFFTLTIKNVPNDLLEMLIKREGGKAYQVLISGIPVDEYDFKHYRRIEHSFLKEISFTKIAWAEDVRDVTLVYNSNLVDDEERECNPGEQRCNSNIDYPESIEQCARNGTWTGYIVKRCNYHCQKCVNAECELKSDDEMAAYGQDGCSCAPETCRCQYYANDHACECYGENDCRCPTYFEAHPCECLGENSCLCPTYAAEHEEECCPSGQWCEECGEERRD